MNSQLILRALRVLRVLRGEKGRTERLQKFQKKMYGNLALAGTMWLSDNVDSRSWLGRARPVLKFSTLARSS